MADTEPRPPRQSPLQQRRREATRLEIAEAAVALFVEQGFAATTVDQIATRAGISLRTFYRYCDSKDDVLAAVFVTGRNRFVEVIATAPAQRPLADVVVSAMLAVMEDDEHPNLRRNASGVMLATPALRQRWLGLIRAVEEDLAPAVATRFGWSPDDVAVPVMAALIISAANTALEHSLRTNTPLVENIARSMAMLDKGLAAVEGASR